MKLKFWKKDDSPKDETIIEVRDIVSLTDKAVDKTIYVKAQSTQKALDLYEELKKRQNK